MKSKIEQLKDIERLIVLQQEKEKKEEVQQALLDAESQELLKLKTLYKDYITLTAEEMEKKKKVDFPPVTVEVKAPNHLDLMIQDYIKEFSKEPWFKKPEPQGNTVTLEFKTEKDTIAFMTKQAELKRVFEVHDSLTHELLAYSDGSGKLFHGDGAEFKPGDGFSAPKPDPKQSLKK